MNNKILRIGIDCRVLQEKNYSGIPNYAYHLIKQLLVLDKKNTYVLFFNSFRNIKNKLPKFDKSKNIEYKIYRIPNKFLEWFWRFFAFPKIDKLLKVDIFFSPHIQNIPLSKNVKKIVTIHDLSFLKNKKYFSFKKNLWHYLMNPKRICNYYDKIIAVSESTKNDIMFFYKTNSKKIFVIYNGSDHLKKISQESVNKNILEKFNLQIKNYFLFISTLEPRKNIESLIEAFNNLKTNKKLLIVGRKGWGYKNIFKKYNKLISNSKIIFTDYVTNEEKNILLSNAYGFLFPSFYEGFGIPVIEAFNYNLPVVSSFNSSLPEIIKDNGILINPHFINEISCAILNVENNKNLINILRSKKNRFNFSWEQNANKVYNVISE